MFMTNAELEFFLLDVAGNLDPETQDQLHKRIARRDQTRAALLQSLASLP